jgi:hypothetical protein
MTESAIAMSDIVKIENLEGMILEIRGRRVLLDREVAQIYGVETRDINKAVANNPDKFPSDYVIELTGDWEDFLIEYFRPRNLDLTLPTHENR